MQPLACVGRYMPTWQTCRCNLYCLPQPFRNQPSNYLQLYLQSTCKLFNGPSKLVGSLQHDVSFGVARDRILGRNLGPNNDNRIEFGSELGLIVCYDCAYEQYAQSLSPPNGLSAIGTLPETLGLETRGKPLNIGPTKFAPPFV